MNAITPHELPSHWREDWAAEYRQPAPARAAGCGLRLLEFRIGGGHYALPTACVSGAAAGQRPRRLPHRQGRLVDGLVNWQGSLQLHADLRCLLGAMGAARAPGAHARTLLLGVAPQVWAVVVDEVVGLFSTTEQALRPLPAALGDGHAPWLRALLQREGRSLTVLDEQALLARLADDVR
jgi:chemotaxis signal transduction protein